MNKRHHIESTNNSSNKSGILSTTTSANNHSNNNYRQIKSNNRIGLTNTNDLLLDQQQQSTSSLNRHHQQYYYEKEQQYFSDDNMEYYIKFPNNYTRNHTEFDTNELSGSDFIFINDDNHQNVPIVLLLGWAGCLDRYLLKYSKIYEDRGLITVRYTAPLKTLFWKRSAMQGIGDKILKLIYDMNFDNHPLIFHVFSNGGAYLYEHISLTIRNQQLPILIRGMIFDSAPGERRMLGLYRAISAIYGQENHKKCNFLIAWAITISLTVIWFAEETYTAFKSLFIKIKPQNTNPFHDLKTEYSDWPQLFLYSKADLVIPYQDVENFARYRENRGINVTKVCFEDAEHVKIFIKYPQQYIHCVCKFVNDCLTSFKGISNYN